jgi:hypothetical protein
MSLGARFVRRNEVRAEKRTDVQWGLRQSSRVLCDVLVLSRSQGRQSRFVGSGGSIAHHEKSLNCRWPPYAPRPTYGMIKPPTTSQNSLK